MVYFADSIPSILKSINKLWIYHLSTFILLFVYPIFFEKIIYAYKIVKLEI